MLRTALIPIAGLGTRMGPLCRAVPKALLPLVDSAGRCRPVLHHVCAEALAAGVARVGLVHSPWQRRLVEQYFDAARQAGDADLPERIEYLEQPTPSGFGEAVLRGRQLAAGEPVMLLLGDYVHRAGPGAPACAAQVASAFADCGGAAMVGMQPVGPEELPRVGVARGELIRQRADGSRLFRCTDFQEKPDLAAARQRLASPGLPAGRFLAHCGIYVFSEEIFACLDEVRSRLPAGAELELAAAQRLLLDRRGGQYLLLQINGASFDTGSPAAYASTFQAFRQGP